MSTRLHALHRVDLTAAVKKQHATDINNLQFRINRCLAAAQEEIAAEANGSPPSFVALRRLGLLVQKAHALNERIQSTASLVESESTEAAHDIPSPTITHLLYDAVLEKRYAQLESDTTAASAILENYLRHQDTLSDFPVSCVGVSPEGVLETVQSASESPGTSWWIFQDVLSSTVGRIPPTAYFTVSSLEQEAEEEKRRDVVASAGQKSTTSNLDGYRSAQDSICNALPQSLPTSSPAATTPETAEETVINDIKEAIHQMKEGALQMSAMMSQERPQLESAEALLSSGVSKGRKNLQELDKVSYLSGGGSANVSGGSIYRLFSAVPGMGLVWNSVLLPIWVFLKQVLFMMLILVTTGVMLVVIATFSKPVKFLAHPAVQLTSQPASASSSRHNANGGTEAVARHGEPDVSVRTESVVPALAMENRPLLCDWSSADYVRADYTLRNLHLYCIRSDGEGPC